MEPSQVRKIVEAAQKDKKNFGPLYEEYYPQIFGYIKKRIERREVAEDLTSKAFEKALKAIDNFQWQGVPFKSWLFRIARNVLTDFYRSQGRKPGDVSFEIVEDFTKDEGLQPDEVYVRDDDESSLYEAMAELDEDDQYLIYYKFFEKLSNVEIAKITGLSETNVGTKLYRIRSKMKGLLEEELKEVE